MDNYALTATAVYLRQTADQQLPATDKLRLAWQLLADAFRHHHLQHPKYADLRELLSRSRHLRFSEPLAFLQFASAVSDAEACEIAAVDSTGFRDEVCEGAILAVADWADSIAGLIDDERQAGHLELIVNQATGEVRRRGYTAAAQFEPGSAEWHMFISAWAAGAPGVSQQQMLHGYSGASAPQSRKTVKQVANQRLAVLGVRLAPNKPPLLEIVPS